MDIDKIRDLYCNQQLNTREIAHTLKISQWQVLSIMKKFNIPRRKIALSLKLRFNKTPLSYQKKTPTTKSEKMLLQAGLMLYWAEGAKAPHGIVDFANSNENMVVIFTKLLRQIYKIDEKRLRAFLYCYSNQNASSLVDFWSKKLKISKSNFTKPYTRTDFDEKKVDKMPHGLIHVRYNDKRLLEQILSDIGIISSELIS